MTDRNRATKIFFFQNFRLGISLAILGPIIPIISKYFSVGLDKIGIAIAVNAFFILIASIVTGNLSGIYDKKTIIITGNILTLISFTGIFFSYEFIYFLVSYSVFGIGVGMIFTTTDSVICDLFKEASGKKLLINAVGSISGIATTTFILSGLLYLNLDWKYLFLFVAITDIPLLFFLGRLNLEKSICKETRGIEKIKNIVFINRKILKNAIIISCGIIMFLYSGLSNGFSSWFTTYYMTLNIPVKMSSIFLGSYQISIICGMFLKRTLLNRINIGKILFTCSILSFIFLVSSVFIPNLILKTLSICLFGISFGGINSLMVSISISVSYEYSSYISSLIQGFSWSGVILFQYLTGFFSEYFTLSSTIYINSIAVFLLLVSVNLLIYIKKLKKVDYK